MIVANIYYYYCHCYMLLCHSTMSRTLINFTASEKHVYSIHTAVHLCVFVYKCVDTIQVVYFVHKWGLLAGISAFMLSFPPHINILLEMSLYAGLTSWLVQCGLDGNGVFGFDLSSVARGPWYVVAPNSIWAVNRVIQVPTICKCGK